MSPSRVLGPGQCPEDCSPDVWRLFYSAANGDLETVRKIIRDDPEAMHHFIWYESPLHYAVRENQLEVVRTLLDAGINPAYSNFTYSSWQSLLPIAGDRGFDEIHALLLSEMQNRFQYDPAYKPLWKSIVAGSVEEVKRQLVADKSLVNIGDEHGNRAIHWAILARRLPMIRILLDAGADVNAKRADRRSPLHLAIDGDYWFGKTNECDTETKAEEVAEFVRDSGAKYEFAAAVAFNDLDHVRAELSKQPELATKLNDARRSPLYLAASHGDTAMVRLLLDHGANPNLAEHCAPSGRALFEASSRNDIEMMTLLIQHGAHADAYVDSCGNCLSIAQQGGPREKEAMELLKRHGALPGEWELDSYEKVSAALDDESFIPNRDMWSSVLGKILELDDVNLLQKYVSRFGDKSIRRLNPAKGWRMPKSQEMLAELLKHGADVNARDWFGRSYLHYAASDESTDRLEWLLSSGADVNAIDHQSGTTALGLAAWNGSLANVEFFLNAGANAMISAGSWARPLALAIAQGHDVVVSRLQNGS